MAINFPNSPNVNDTHTEGGVTWKWDGTSWNIQDNASNYTLPIATAGSLGGIKVGSRLTINATTGVLDADVQGGGGGGATTLGALTDVDVTGASNGKIIKYNGSSWEIADDLTGGSLALTDLSNVDATTNLANGKILKYNGTSWEVADDQSGGGGGGGGNVAVGSVMIWSGSAVSIPSGWQLCDGTNGSPDLRDKFVVGAGTSYAVDATGGSADAVVVSHNHGITDPGHDHDIEVVTDSGSGNNSKVDENPSNSNGVTDTTGIQSNTTGITVNNEGVSGTNANLPPYYALCYIYCTAAGSNQTFLGLGDTPGSYTANQWLKVNSAGNGVEFTNAPSTYGDSDVDTHLNQSNPTSGHVLSWNGSDYAWVAQTTDTNTFTGLTGTPSSYTADKWLKVNAGGTALEYTDAPSVTETDTLDTVTGRGGTTSNNIAVGNFQCDNLTVNGTQTIINSNTVNIGDNILVLNGDESGTPSQNGGIEIERGTSTNVSIRWNETTDKWEYTNDGSNFSAFGTGGGEANVQVDWNQSNSAADDFIKNKPTLFSGSYNDLSNKPTLFSGSYNDLSNKPTLFSGSYNDLSNKPTIPAAQIQSDWNQTNSSALDFIKNKPSTTTDTNDYVNSASFSGSTITLGRTGSQSLADLTVDIGNITNGVVPVGTIVMYNGDVAPAGWVLCDGVQRTVNGSPYTPPDLRDKFIVGAGNSYTRGDEGGDNTRTLATSNLPSHAHDAGNFGSNNTGGHTHDAGNYGSNNTGGHTHGGGNYAAGNAGSHTHGDGNYSTSNTGDHSHSQSGSGSGNTGNQSANHVHTMSTNVSTNNTGSHSHNYNTASWDNQSDYTGPYVQGGTNQGSRSTSNTGGHAHNFNITADTLGISANHTHSFNFNIGGNTGDTGSHSHNVSGNSGSVGDHSHNMSGNSGSAGDHSHNISGNTGSAGAHSHTISGNTGSVGSGSSFDLRPPYYAITFIIKTL